MCRVTDPHTEPFPLFHDVDDDAGDEDDAGGSPAKTHRDKCKGSKSREKLVLCEKCEGSEELVCCCWVYCKPAQRV